MEIVKEQKKSAQNTSSNQVKITDLDFTNPEQRFIQQRHDSNLAISESENQNFIDLLELMQQEKPFLSGDLTLDKLAKLLNTNRTYLSQTIKENTSSSFNDFVNEYRVDEARRMLSESEFEHLSIEGIANSVGFNSKSTFNKSFKQFTGITPSYFRNSVVNVR